MNRIPGQSTRGLAVAGLIVLALGVGAAFCLREWSPIISQQERFRLVLLYTATASGLLFIAATARWWMRH